MWRMRAGLNGTPAAPPRSVYRYMDQRHIDRFFTTGELKLSSFESNRKIEDEVRQDQREGHHQYQIVSRDRSKVQELHARVFNYHCMFCCSTDADTTKMMKRFGVDGCFEIFNTTGFGYEVARVLQSFSYGQEGFVQYTDTIKSVLLLEQHLHLPDLTLPFEIGHTFPYISALSEMDMEIMFRKRLRFVQDQEFRIVWRTAPDHHLLILCPDALRFCRKVT